MTPVLVDRSQLRLSEVARHVVIPEGIVDSLWFEVAERCEEFGDEFDAWQDGLGQAILGLREDGLFAATVGGITLSIPRQVAKTFIVMRIVVALCTMFPNLTVIWTAHRMRTTTGTFQKMKAFVLRPAVRGYLRAGSNQGTAIRDANGEQEIPFANGSRILFGAREQGFGRGFDEIDVEVFDEAQILTERALDDMIAATNQSRWVHGALLFYMGTPPRPVDPGRVFTTRRGEALEMKRDAGGVDFGAPVEAGDALFVECSADPNVGRPGGPSLNDNHQIEKANPSYPHRTPPVSIKRLRKNLASDDGWRREGLGVWDEDQSTDVISLAAWAARWAPAADVTSPVVLAVETTLDRAQSVVVAVGSRPDDTPQAEVAAQGPGTSWVAGEVVRMALDNDDVAAIVVDDRSPAKPLAESIQAALEAAELADVDLVVTSSSDMAEACAQVLDAINDGPLVHLGDPVMLAAVKAAVRRDIGDGAWAWSRRKGGAAVAPLVAMTIGLWAWSQLAGNDYDVTASLG